MATLFLPQLEQDNNISKAEAGQWQQNSTLDECAKDLVHLDEDATKISSIPDLWARPATFKIMLQEKDKDYVAQWRGVLAILALKELRHIDGIELHSIKLQDTNEENIDFYRAAMTMLPEDYRKYRLSENEEQHIEIVSYAGKPLAIVWPSVLICPAVDLNFNGVTSPVPWWKRGVLEDPCQYITGKECKLLIDWLGEVKKGVSAAKIVNRDTDMILQNIEDFQKDLRNNNLVESKFAIGNNIGITGFSEVVGCPIKCEFSQEDFKSSNVMMNSLDGNEHILVVTKTYEKQWGKRLTDINVAGHVNVKALEGKIFGGLVTGKDDLLGVSLVEFNTKIWTDGDFFTRKLGLVTLNGCKAKTIFPNVVNAELLHINYCDNEYAVILPFNEEVLKYYSPEYIGNHFEIKVKGSDITIIFEILVSGIVDANGETKRKLRIERTFREQDILRDEYIDPPYSAVWPNFVPHDEKLWQKYYTFYDTNNNIPQSTFRIVPFQKNTSEGIRKLQLANSYEAEIISVDRFPDSFVCSYIDEIGDFSSLGIMCLKIKKLDQQSKRSCTIGIDFGTTNTIAYMKFDDDSEPERIVFQNRIYKITEPGSGVELRRHFIPATVQPEADNSSIRTLFHKHQDSYNGDISSMLMRGNIYYLEGAKSIQDDKIIASSVVADLKWGENTEMASSFLLQYCMQCMAEAVTQGATSINWVYSYPQAFTKKGFDRMNRIWNNEIIPRLKAVCPGNEDFIRGVSHKTESRAAMEYFDPKKGGHINVNGMMCFDIGGGSTDMALWYGKDGEEANDLMKFQASIKFAGRNILNDYLYEYNKGHKGKLKLLETSEENFNEQLGRVLSSEKKEEFSLQMEAMLKYYEKDIVKSLIMRGSDDEDLNKILRDVGYALAGIFFYGGIAVANLTEDGKYIDTGKMPECFVGGNASKLLNWAALGDFAGSKAFRNLLTISFAEGVRFVKGDEWKPGNKFVLRLSEKPKEEVSYGLVKESFKNKNDNNEDNSIDVKLEVKEKQVEIFGGEHFEKKNGEQAKYISADDILENNISLSREMVALKYFTNVFNKHSKNEGLYNEPIKYTEEELSFVCDNIEQSLLNKRDDADGDKDKIDVEPLFIMELREVLKILSKR